jgi:hypothetical protein
MIDCIDIHVFERMYFGFPLKIGSTTQPQAIANSMVAKPLTAALREEWLGEREGR